MSFLPTPLAIEKYYMQLLMMWVATFGAGSSKEVRGNPTEYYRRAGSGTSKGVGIKLGAVRAEYATDGKSGSIFMRFGERF